MTILLTEGGTPSAVSRAAHFIPSRVKAGTGVGIPHRANATTACRDVKPTGRRRAEGRLRTVRIGSGTQPEPRPRLGPRTRPICNLQSVICNASWGGRNLTRCPEACRIGSLLARAPLDALLATREEPPPGSYLSLRRLSRPAYSSMRRRSTTVSKKKLCESHPFSAVRPVIFRT